MGSVPAETSQLKSRFDKPNRLRHARRAQKRRQTSGGSCFQRPLLEKSSRIYARAIDTETKPAVVGNSAVSLKEVDAAAHGLERSPNTVQQRPRMAIGRLRGAGTGR